MSGLWRHVNGLWRYVNGMWRHVNGLWRYVIKLGSVSGDELFGLDMIRMWRWSDL